MTWMEIFNRLTSQITSGRWILTIVASYCLVVLTKTLCVLMELGKVTLETATYVAIVMSVLNTVSMVAVFYFQKPRLSEDSTTSTTTNLG